VAALVAVRHRQAPAEAEATVAGRIAA